MLTPDLVDQLLAPISDGEPCGPDLEYDPAFMALTVAAQGKAEQQFGDTIIAAVEPEWPQIAQQAGELLGRSKDLRCAVLLLRAATRMQGLQGACLGLDLLVGLLERFRDDLHPGLDPDDDNDPTMRLNALAALNDERGFIRDLYDAGLGIAAGIGPIRVRDVAVARGVLAPIGESTPLSAAAVQGALDDIVAAAPQTAEDMRAIGARIDRLSAVVSEHLDQSPDFKWLRPVAQLLLQAAPASAGAAATAPGATPETAPSTPSIIAAGMAHGEIRTRQDVLQTLDRVIRYLEQAEPGNPAPLLIARAKQLIGVSFLEIISNLAPNALEAIEVVTGPRTEA